MAGAAVAQPTDGSSVPLKRELTLQSNCSKCHSDFKTEVSSANGFHGGSRYDPKYCVVCHTDQRKYGQARATSTLSSRSRTARSARNAAAGSLRPAAKIL